jgi:phosphomannomutase
VGDRLEGLAHAALEELLVSSGNATARAAAARLVVDRLSGSSSLSMDDLARRAASEEIRAKMEAEAPALRAKLTRLIEDVRPSNTESLLRLNLEALDTELMQRKRDEVLAVIRS